MPCQVSPRQRFFICRLNRRLQESISWITCLITDKYIFSMYNKQAVKKTNWYSVFSSTCQKSLFFNCIKKGHMMQCSMHFDVYSLLDHECVTCRAIRETVARAAAIAQKGKKWVLSHAHLKPLANRRETHEKWRRDSRLELQVNSAEAEINEIRAEVNINTLYCVDQSFLKSLRVLFNVEVKF